MFTVAIISHAEQIGKPDADMDVAAVVRVPDLCVMDSLEFVFQISQNAQENGNDWAKEGGNIIAVTSAKRPTHRSTTAGDIISLYSAEGARDFQVTDVRWTGVGFDLDYKDVTEN